MNNLTLEHPNPVRIKGPSRLRQVRLEREEWYIPSDSNLATVVEIEDEPINIAFIPEGLLSILRRWYEFRDEAAVADFLQENSFLIPVLFSAHKKIRDNFLDPKTRIILEIVSDPEAPGDQELFAVIRTRFQPKIARTLLSELDREWWRGVLPTTQGKMELDVE